MADDLNLIINTLREALEKPDRLSEYIRNIQRFAENEESLSPATRDVLGDLAYDLEFYEPDPDARDEDASFIGEEQALAEIKDALKRILIGA